MKIAVLICSHFECMDKFNIQLKTLFKPGVEYDFYIYTNKRYAPEVATLPNVKSVQYIEDNPETLALETHIKTIHGCSNIFQYYNLQKCFALLEKSGNTYDFVYRIRPDIWKDTYKLQYKGRVLWAMKRDMTEPFWTPETVDGIPDNTIYAKTDQFYVGNMATMRKVCNLADFLETFYFGANDAMYLPLDYKILAQCDMNSCRFDMLNYPAEFISKQALTRFAKAKPGDWDITDMSDPEWRAYIAEKDVLKKEIQDNLPMLIQVTNPQKLVNSGDGSFGRFFRGEKSFAHYVTSVCHIIIKELPNIRNCG